MASNLGLKVQPPPIRVTDMSAAEWSRWFMDLQRALTSAAVAVSWSSLDFTGANITDLAFHRHVDLQGLQGGAPGEFYHLSAAEKAGIAGVISALITHTWIPVFTGLTVVLSGGSVAYAGRYQQVGKLVKFTVTITPTGGATVAATAGTTYCTMGSPASIDDVCSAANATSKTPLSQGFIDSTNDRIYMPSWAATTDTIVISGSYEA